MALPDYYRRNAFAITQAISGLDEDRLGNILGAVCIGITFDAKQLGCEGHAIIDLLVRLLARLYPSIWILDESHTFMESDFAELATRINPRIELAKPPTLEIVVGSSAKKKSAPRCIFVGCHDWTAILSSTKQHTCGNSDNPFGAGLAACLAAAAVFRFVFLSENPLARDLELAIPKPCAPTTWQPDRIDDLGRIVLAGAGAIGNSVVWALSRITVQATVEIVDPEAIDLGNIQRYALAERTDENEPKAKFLSKKLGNSMNTRPFIGSLSEFFERRGYKTDLLLLALDSANARCEAQASLPRRIINAWTQPDDLGISVHDFLNGACVNCLYMPKGECQNEDEIVASALGIADRLMDVRNLLHNNKGATHELLKAIAYAKDIKIEKLLPFLNLPLRQLYVEGFCGGAVISSDEFSPSERELHVPLAHQSALAGILLAAAAISHRQTEPEQTTVSQYNVLQTQDCFQTYPVAKDAEGRCICQDMDYVQVYLEKYDLGRNSP